MLIFPACAIVVATLLTTNGVTAPSGPQNYGALADGGASVSRSFTFTANGVNGDTILATFLVQDGSVNYDFTGKLSYSWPRDATGTPLNVNHEPYDPLFPFGFGLTYAAPTELAALPEDPGVPAELMSTGSYFDKGVPVQPWSLRVSSGSCRTWRSVNALPIEASLVLTSATSAVTFTTSPVALTSICRSSDAVLIKLHVAGSGETCTGAATGRGIVFCQNCQRSATGFIPTVLGRTKRPRCCYRRSVGSRLQLYFDQFSGTT